MRDVGQVVGLAVSLLMFLSPIFFPLQSLPVQLQGWAMLNPLTLPITLTHAVLIDGRWPDWGMWAMHLGACTVLAVLGAALFRKARGGFADVV